MGCIYISYLREREIQTHGTMGTVGTLRHTTAQWAHLPTNGLKCAVSIWAGTLEGTP
jgi:hypothetical protein